MDGQAPNLQNLIEILKHELALHKQLFDVLNAERAALVDVDLKQIREVTFTKEGLLADIQREEVRRRRWVDALSDYSGITPNDLSAEKVAEVYGGLEREQLVSLRNGLRYLLMQAREINSENQKLTENALRESQLLKENALGMGGDRAATYGPKGSMGMAKDRGSRIITREA